MSQQAQTLFELIRLAQGGAGALTEHLLHAVAAELVSPKPMGAQDAHNPV